MFFFFRRGVDDDAVFQPAALHMRSDSVWIEELSGVAAMIVKIERAEDFADAQHIGPGYSLKGPWVLVVGLPLGLFLLHDSQTLSAHHLFENTRIKKTFCWNILQISQK